MLRNRLCYGLVLLGTGLFFLCYNGYVSYYVFLLSLLLPVVSLALSLPGMLTMRLSLSLDSPDPYLAHLRKGEAVTLRLGARCPWPFTGSRVKLRLAVRNTLTGEERREWLVLVPSREALTLEHSLASPTCGLVECTPRPGQGLRPAGAVLPACGGETAARLPGLFLPRGVQPPAPGGASPRPGRGGGALLPRKARGRPHGALRPAALPPGGPAVPGALEAVPEGRADLGEGAEPARVRPHPVPAGPKRQRLGRGPASGRLRHPLRLSGAAGDRPTGWVFWARPGGSAWWNSPPPRIPAPPWRPCSPWRAGRPCPPLAREDLPGGVSHALVLTARTREPLLALLRDRYPSARCTVIRAFSQGDGPLGEGEQILLRPGRVQEALQGLTL